jgi:hypothetical protein
MMRVGMMALALLSAPVMAQPHSVDPTPRAEVMSLSYQVAQVTNSETLTRLQLNKMLGETLPKQFAANPDFVEMESRFPGITAAFIEKLSPAIVDTVIPRLPELWARVSPVYARSFSENELRELLNFYRSPVGTRMIEIIGKRGDFTRLLGEAMRTSDPKVSAEGISSGIDIGIRAVGAEMSAADKAEIQRFESSPLGPKLLSIRPELAAMSAEWGNEPSPSDDAKVDAAIRAFFDGYLKDHAEGKVAQ